MLFFFKYRYAHIDITYRYAFMSLWVLNSVCSFFSTCEQNVGKKKKKKNRLSKHRSEIKIVF